MQLTKHFSLAELIESDTAIRLGIDNTPSPNLLDPFDADGHCKR